MTTALERKALPSVRGKDGTTSSPMTGVIGHDDAEGTVTAIVAVSGVRDRVGDLIVPGALGRSLKRVKPKGVNNHQWGAKVSRVVWIEELMPGDGRLPELTSDGSPWPREAGTLMVKAKYNLDKEIGRDAYADAKFYGPDENFSIGYVVPDGGSRKTRAGRNIHELNVYEWSQVLHGAHQLASLVGVKSLVDEVDAPDSWYAGQRSGYDEGSSNDDYGVEYKAANMRTVKDPEYWGLPYGTPIRAGQRPRGKTARAIRRGGAVPDTRYGTTTTGRTESRSTPAAVRKASETDQPALVPEQGARRVKPGKPRKEASTDPAADLVALLKDTQYDVLDQDAVNSLLGEVLDDALTPDEFEDELRDAVESADVRDDDLESVLDDYRARYIARLAEQEGRAEPKPEEREALGPDYAKEEARGAAERAAAKASMQPGRAQAIDNIDQVVARLKADDPYAGNTRKTLALFQAPGAEIRTSPDGRFAAVNNGKTWVTIDTRSGAGRPGFPPGTAPEKIDAELATRAEAAAAKDRDRPGYAIPKPEGKPEPAAEPEPTPQDALRDVASRARATGNTALADYLAPFLGSDAEIRTSSDGTLAAAQGSRGWMLAEIATGNAIPHLPVDTDSEQVDAALAELASLDIPWGDPEAARQRWSDAGRRHDDKQTVRAVIERHSRPKGEKPPKEFTSEAGRREESTADVTPPATSQPGANEVRQARRAAEDAIQEQDRDALADALTRMGVGTGDDDRDPREVAGGMLTIPTEVVTQRLDRLEQAATMVVEPESGSKPSVRSIADMTLDELRAERDLLLRARTPEQEARYNEVNDEVFDRQALEAGQRRESDRVQQLIAQAKSDLALRRVLRKTSDEELTKAAGRSKDRVRKARIKEEQDRRKTIAGPVTPPEPESAEPDAVITPDDQAAAEALRGDALGLVEAEDGELEVTEEVAQRQDRIEALIENEGADLGNRTADELGGTRRDLVAELALQDEIRRRDAQRRQERRTQVTERQTHGAGETDTEAPPASIEGPKVRPGLAGAVQDLADLLNERGLDAVDDPDIRAAAERLQTVLKRNKNDEGAVAELRKLLGDDVHAAIKAKRLRPGVLYTLGGKLRQEARDRRNAAARVRRKARRIEREKLRSLIGVVDGYLRRRGRDPEQYGGPIHVIVSKPESTAPDSREPEPDAGDLATHQRPAELVAEDQASSDRAAQARDLIQQARQASEDGDHARAVDLMEQAQQADLARADRMTEMRDRFTALRDDRTSQVIDEDRYLDARADTAEAALEGARIKLLRALKEMGVTDPDELRLLRDRLTAATDADAVDAILREIDDKRDNEIAWLLDPEREPTTDAQLRRRDEAGDETVVDRNGPVNVTVSGPEPGDTGQREEPEPAPDNRQYGTPVKVPLNAYSGAPGTFPTLPGDQLREGDWVYDKYSQRAGRIVSIGSVKEPGKLTNPNYYSRKLTLSDDKTTDTWTMGAADSAMIAVLNAPDNADAPATRQEAKNRAVEVGKQAQEALTAGDQDSALRLLTQAHSLDPANDRLSNQLRKARAQRRSQGGKALEQPASVTEPKADAETPESVDAVTTAASAVKRPGRDGATEYVVTLPDGTEKKISVARDYNYVRIVDVGEGVSTRYITTLHTDEEAASQPHPLFRGKPVTAVKIDDEQAAEQPAEERPTPAPEAPATVPERARLPREVMTTDGRSVLVKGEDGDQVHIYDPVALRTETLQRDQILPGGPTKDDPATVKLSDKGPEHGYSPQMVAALRFEDVRDGSLADDELGATLSDDRANLVVHNVAQAVGVLDEAVSIIEENIKDRVGTREDRARRRQELTATRRLRAKIAALATRQGAQSAPTEGEPDGQRAAAPDRGALPEVSAGEARGDESGRLPGAGDRDASRDRDGGGRSAAADRPEPARRPADRAVPGGTPDRGGDGAAGGADRPERTGDRAGQRRTGTDESDRGAADAGGRDAEDGSGGVREREGGAEPDSAPEGEPGEGVTGADQPDAQPGQVDAIPDTGESFRPGGVDDLARPGERAKLDDNMAALRVLRRLQSPPKETRRVHAPGASYDIKEPGKPRSATPEEQAILARWAGWGGLPDVFDESKPKYEAERIELKELLSPAEYNEARRNTLNAHYTDARAVQAIWKAVQDLGFDGGQVLEPGSGSGNFIGFAPDSARMVGVELDSTTAAISKALYPHAEIRNESFAKTRLPDGIFDATVGNVPFGKFSLTDKRHNRDSESIHNHFILKSLALTKPGGLVTVLTSRYTMDSERNAARRKMADMADLVGAVRLPTGSQRRAAGVDVVADVLIFRRREPGAEPRGDQSWINAEKRDLDGWEIPLNDYWDAHPDHVLGEMTGASGQYGGDLRVVGDKDMADLPSVLTTVVADAKATGLTATPHDPDAAGIEFAAPNAMHEGGIAANDDGDFVQNVDGVMVPFDVPDSQREELRGLLGLRDALIDLLDAEAATDRDTPQIQELRQELNDRYDAHVAKFRPINFYELNKVGARKPRPQGGFRRDPRSASVRALENYNADDGTATKAAIFTKRAVAPRQLMESADNPTDALALCMDKVGRVDLPTIAQLLNTDEDDARAQLGDLVYEQPPLSEIEADLVWRRERAEAEGLPQVEGRFGGSRDFGAAKASDADMSAIGESVRQAGALVPTAEYLSGNVRRKLAAAKAAAEHDPRFKANVDALEEVIPTDLTPQEIEGRLGAAWIGADDVQDFLVDLLELEKTCGDRASARQRVKVAASGSGIWTVDAPGWGNLATETWGTDDRAAGELVQAMLEQRPIKITRSVEGPDGKKKNVPDLEATLAAQAKAEAIADRFSEWLWEDGDRATRLQGRYNANLNAIRLRSYDGTRRELPGKAKGIDLWDHQHAAVSRVVSEPAALLAHVVGSGKTMEAAASAMELNRLGLAKKPTIVVPNHMKEQFEREFLQLYPQARLLAAGSEDLEGPKRREFAARAATGDWDCIILTQKAFEAIPMSSAQQQAYIDREMADMRRQLEEAKAQAEASGDDAAAQTVKRMEKAILSAEQKLEEKLEKGLKDVGGVTFEQTGIDYVFIDEAHHYSNLRTLSNIQGAGATGSGMATDLHMKIEYLRETNASNRVVTFMTGTPIRNTVTQCYIMMRYLRPDLLKEAGINSFDQWAATFGKIIEEMELKPEGSGFRQTARFAKFQNVPELLQILHVFTDVKMAEDLKLPTPELAGGKVDNVVVPRTAQCADFIKELGQRAERVRSGDPDKFMRIDEKTGVAKMIEDNMLLVSMDGRKAALDMRLVGGDPEAGKIDAAADRISSIWNTHKDRRYPLDPKNPDMGDDPTSGALQIVFLDMGTPPSGKNKSDWNAYDDLKAKLVARGMDEKSIRYMHEAKNDREKAEMFAAARSGRISVLIGSTEKMGVGTNVQARAVALHHLDAPWRPSDVEQRDGRIMRQGNAHQGMGIPVEIIRYVTEGSFDAYMWQTLERKSKFINQILRGSLNVREIEDVGENSLSYAEVKALATGNPDLMDKAKIDTLLGKLTRLSRTHERTQANLRRDVARYTERIAANDSEADMLDEAIGRRVDTSGDKFVATVGDERHAKRTEANAALNAALYDVLTGWNQDPVTVGSLGGFDVVAQLQRVKGRGGWELAVTLGGIPDEVVTYGMKDLRDGKAGTVARIENRLASLEAARNRRRATAETLRGELPRMQERIGLEFGRAEELAAAQAKSDRLRAKMLLDIQRLDGKEIPFNPHVDSARYDSPLVGGGTAADAPPDPDGEIERAEWERMWELRRTQAAADREQRAAGPSPAEQAQSKARAALEPGSQYLPGGRATLETFVELAPDEIHASEDGRVAAVQRKDGKWVAFDVVTGLNLSLPDWSYVDFQGNVDAVLAELAQLSIPWGDAPLQRAKRDGRGSDWGRQIVNQAREIWERHASPEPEEKSLQVEAIITPIESLRAQRLRAELEQVVSGMRGFA